MAPTGTIHFTLDGQPIQAEPGETLLQAAQRHGTEIPHLCYRDGQRADGNCRACVVEIEGERVLAASCCRQPTSGMVVHSDNARATEARKAVLELLVSDVSATPYHRDSELQHWADACGADNSRFSAAPPPTSPSLTDLSHPAIAVNLDACIQCGRCVRACREVQVNDVIGWSGRGPDVQITFDLNTPLGASSCVGCGECVQACPTGALAPANGAALETPDKVVNSVCPYCGVGCLLEYQVKDNRILAVNGRNGEANRGRLCVKGRFGFDYVNHPERLTRPLVRRQDAPKQTALPADPLAQFREASWEEALDLAAEGFKRVRETHGARALAGFGSAKGSNEEAYLFQKLIRTGFGSNNVDHCTRLCHASSVAALLEGIGSGAVSNPVVDVRDAEVIVVIGANPESNHPVAASLMKNAAKAGKKLVLMDPRRTPLARHASHLLQFKPDTDVAMLNALIHCIIEEGLTDQAFIDARTEGFAALRDNVAAFSPEAMAPVCGIPAPTLREVARLYARSNGSMIFWGMGVSQHIHGTDNARCLIALAMITGQIGRPGTGLHPLRGQNNVQGASDAGLIPMVFPDYQRVDDPQALRHFEKLWRTKLDPQPGLTVVEIMHAAIAGELNGLYIMGENPAMSDPNLNETRPALAALEHLVVQDLFLTETAAFADVILPASAFPEKTGTFTNTDRRVQLGRQALDPPDDARQDLWIIQQIAQRLGLNWNYGSAADVFAEMRQAMPSIAGISWERLERQDSVTYPCPEEQSPGQAVLFETRFPTPTGRARLVPAGLIPGDEQPDKDYPLILLTGRILEHWHTGSMTRRSRVLNSLEPDAWVAIHPQDLRALGAREGEPVRVVSRRGEIQARAKADPTLQPGEVFMPFCYVEAAANLLTNDALDPFGKIPEFKYCAVKVAPAAE